MDPDDKIYNIKLKNMREEAKVMHYYGDKIRTLYIVIAIIMLVMTPFVKDELPVPGFVSIVLVILLAMFAGFTNPKSKIVLFSDFLISVTALVFFGYEMIISYNGLYSRLFFISNIALSILSVFAVYFSSKTLRGSIVSSSH